jgi:hypothetical protein
MSWIVPPIRNTRQKQIGLAMVSETIGGNASKRRAIEITRLAAIRSNSVQPCSVAVNR